MTEPNNYLFFCAHGYAIPILRPLQDEIVKRGHRVAWFLEPTCPADQLNREDVQLHSLKEVKQWNPRAVFAPGDWVYDFFPGVKVRVCHGYPIYKRGGTEETHFRLRGWFDIHCSSGPSSTPVFKELEAKHPWFCAYETGWVKADAIIKAKNAAEAEMQKPHEPTIFVATTFSKRITQLRNLLPTITRLAQERSWRWVITMHPKLEDPELRTALEELAKERENVEFYPVSPMPDVMAHTDVMLCDASSITVEYMLLDRPVVTLRNTTPGPHILNVESVDEVEGALEKALQRPEDLMNEMRKYVAFHESHLDGNNAANILNAVDDFIENRQKKLRHKPLNLFRRLKVRWRFVKVKREV